MELSGGSEVDTAQVYIRRDEIAASGGPARRHTNDEAGLDEVIESWEQKIAPGFRRRSNSYVSRAAFVGLLPHEQSLIRNYVHWLLRPGS